MSTTVEGKTIRLACNQSSNEEAVDKWSGESLMIWRGATTQIECTLFDSVPSANTIVNDLTNIVSATLFIRRNNAKGTVLLAKTVLKANMDLTVSWSDYLTDLSQHIKFSLSAPETNQTVNSAGVLPIYFVVKITTTTSDYVAAFGYGEIIDVGIVDVAEPIPAGLTSIYTNNMGIVQNSVVDFPSGVLKVNGTFVYSGGPPSLKGTFGGFNDGITSNDNAFTTAMASSEPVIYVGSGTFVTNLYASQLDKRFIGPGTIITQGTNPVNSQPGNLTWMQTRPTSAYDWSRVQAEKFVLENVRNGLDEPYFFTPTTPHSLVFDNRAGHSGAIAKLAAQANIGATTITLTSTVGLSVGRVIAFGVNGTGSERVTISGINTGTNVVSFNPPLAAVHTVGTYVTDGARTMQQGYYIEGTHRAGGDMYGMTFRMVADHAALAGQEHIFKNSTIGMWGGDLIGAAPGVYITPWELQVSDQGFDIGVLTPMSYSRNNNTGARGAIWGGLYLQSQGTYAMNFGYGATGIYNIGLDFALADFASNGGCAIGLAAGHYIYYNNSATSGAETLYGNVLGNVKTGYNTTEGVYEIWVGGNRIIGVHVSGAFWGSEVSTGKTVEILGNSGNPGFVVGAPSIGKYLNFSMRHATGRGLIAGQDTAAASAPIPIDVIASVLAVTGTLSASNLSGTNTGDQDLSNYQTKTGTLALAGFSSITGTLPAVNVSTLNQNTTGSAASLSISGQTGLLTFTGLTSTSRIKTIRDAADTILELGGSYIPTGTWTSLTLVTPVLGMPTSGNLSNCTFPTLNQNTTGSAAKWTTARNLAGNSVDGSATVAFANKFIVQGTTDTGLSAAQFLGALSTGILKNTTTTGVLSIAVAGDFPTLNQNTTGSAATVSAAAQTNITSLGTLTSLTVSGQTNLGDATVFGVGVTTPSFGSNNACLAIGSNQTIHGPDALGAGGALYLSQNASFAASAQWKYISTDLASNYYQYAGTHVFRTAVSGTPGNVITWATMLTLDANRVTMSLPAKLKGYTVATLPSGSEGDWAYVTDATAPTYNGALTGSGAVKIPVFYNGSAWVSH